MPYGPNYRGAVDAANAVVVAAGGQTSVSQPASMVGLINRLYAYNRALGSSTFINQKPDSWETVNRILNDCLVTYAQPNLSVPDNIEGTITLLKTLLIANGGTIGYLPDSFSSLVQILTALISNPGTVLVPFTFDSTDTTFDSTYLGFDRN